MSAIGGLAAGATRHLFFTGKGGVGKTSVACATALRLAEGGRRVLLVSTDPASNLDEVLGTTLGTEATLVRGVPGLHAMNLDPAAEAAAYRERAVGPYRGLLPDAAVATMEEQLSGACTMEIAAFDRFAALLADPAATAAYQHVVFDTAPTGHTLRLLALPSAWTGYLDANTTGVSCLGPLSGLQAQQALYRNAMERLRDGGQTALVLVARPERPALREAERTRAELAALGVANQHLVLNGLFTATDPGDPYAHALEVRGRAALADMPAGLAALPSTRIALRATGPVGLDALRTLGERTPDAHAATSTAEADDLTSLGDLVDEVAAEGRGVVLTMGKGGVGKTTVAAAVAVALAERGHRVHLSTTDPAAHLEAALGEAAENLTVGRIDPVEETRRYTEEVLASAGEGLDADGRALLEEDLRSPCTEEVAVFRAFARTVAAGQDGFVVLDTAPTGHTLLLLDATESYHREVTRGGSPMPEEVRTLLPRLRDPAYTRVLVVTLAETTPVLEAERLEADLARAQIHPFAWVVNASLAPLPVRDPVLAGRREAERPHLARVRDGERRVAVVAWTPEEPVGAERLRVLTTSGTIAARS